MRIGAASHLPPQLPQPAKRTAPTLPSEPSSHPPERSQVLSAVDWSQRARQADADSFYSTDRSLPFSGRAAIELYLTNAGINWQPGEAELLGIDLYA